MKNKTIFSCAQKLTGSQLNLPHETKNRSNEENRKQKKQDAQKKRSGNEVRGVSPEAGRESVMGKFVKELSFEPGVKE